MPIHSSFPRPIRNVLFPVAAMWLLPMFTLHAEEPEPDVTPHAAQRIEALLPELMEQHHTPGVSITLIKGRRIVWSRGFGVLAADGDAPVDAETVFEACSMSKPLFTFGVMTLVEDGRLELDRPLVEYRAEPYLPDEPLHRLITARMVMQHTSGLPNWREGGWRSGGPLPVRFEPGTQYSYSGEGFWYLQQVVEEVLGKQMAPWMQRTVLEPLGMTHSSYVWQPEYEESAAAGHDEDGHVKTNRPHFDRENGAYTLYTTADDYARFLLAMMPAAAAEPQVLTRSSLEAMLTPVVETDKPEVRRGLGWAITKSENDSYVWHNGSNGTGFRCYSRFRPEHGDGMVIMTNAVGGAGVWEGVVEAIDGAGEQH